MVLSFEANSNKRTVDDNKTAISTILKVVGYIEPHIKIGKPKTIPILNILVPMMFPKVKSNSFFLTETILIIISGSDVPIVIIVIEMIFSLTFRDSAIRTELSTIKLLPIIIIIKPIIV